MNIKTTVDYNSLEKVSEFLKTKTNLEVSVTQDVWATGDELMLKAGKKCILIKKSATAGAKINMLDSSELEINPIAPSGFIHNMTHRGILAVIIDMIISKGQNEVVQEVKHHLSKIQNNHE